MALSDDELEAKAQLATLSQTKLVSLRVAAAEGAKDGDPPAEARKDHRRSANPYLSKFKDDWEQVIAKTSGVSAYVCVTEMIEHIVSEMKRAYEGTTHEDDQKFYHDALILMTSKSTIKWMKENG